MTPRRPWARAARLRAILASALLVGVALLLLAPSAFAAPTPPAGSDPVIVWDQSMIYGSQNGGNPWGPVGEHARVQGQHFPDGQYKLVLGKGDVNNDPSGTGLTVCGPANLIDLSLTVTVSGGTQTFDASFDWPAAAGQVHAAYSICALKAADGSLASHLDTGPFTVLAASAPHIQLSAATLAPGATLTVTGKNFVPPQSILVYAAPCQNCGAPKTAQATVTSADPNAGTFTATLTIPAGTTPGSFYVGAISQNGVLSAPEQTLAVAAPSPTATARPSPTATTAPTAAATPTQAGSGGNTNNTTDNSPLVVALLIAALVLLAVLAGLIAYLIARRPTPAAVAYRPGESIPAGSKPGVPPVPYGAAAPPPLPMPDELPRDEMPTQAGSWDPGATRAVQQPAAAPDPASYDAPTDPGLRSARDPNA